MAFSYVGHYDPYPLSTTGSSINVSSTGITGVQAGDIIFCGWYVDGNGTSITPPSGWTLIDQQTVGGSFVFATYWHVYTSSEPANWTWTIGTSTDVMPELVAFRPDSGQTVSVDAHVVGTTSPTSSVSYSGADFLIAFSVAYGAGEQVPGSGGFTQVQSGNGLWTGYVIETGAGSTGSVAWSGGLAPYAMSIIAFKEAAGGGGSIVSGSANVQSNSVIGEAGQIVTKATEQANAALGEAAQLVTAATEQANAGMSVTGTILQAPAAIQPNAVITEAARIVAPSVVEQANAVLAATGGIVGGIVAGSATMQANAALAEASALVLAPAVEQSNALLAVSGGVVGKVEGSATIAANAALAVAARIVTPSATLQANAVLSAPAQVTQPSIAAQSNATLAQSSARVTAPASLQANAALTIPYAVLVALAAILQANAVLAASGHIPLPANYHRPTGTTARRTAGVPIGTTARRITEPTGTTGRSTEPVGSTVRE